VGVIYLDACLLIYFVEEHPCWGKDVATAIAHASGTFAIPPLVKCECMLGPLRRNDLVVESHFRAVFAEFDTLDMPEPVYLQAARLRAAFGLKTPDALHLACAQHHRCQEVWTHDERLANASHGLAKNILAR
jgi:predicted nucleic acid-binding protein